MYVHFYVRIFVITRLFTHVHTLFVCVYQSPIDAHIYILLLPNAHSHMLTCTRLPFLLSQRASFVTVKIFESKVLMNRGFEEK